MSQGMWTMPASMTIGSFSSDSDVSLDGLPSRLSIDPISDSQTPNALKAKRLDSLLGELSLQPEDFNSTQWLLQILNDDDTKRLLKKAGKATELARTRYPRRRKTLTPACSSLPSAESAPLPPPVSPSAPDAPIAIRPPSDDRSADAVQASDIVSHALRPYPTVAVASRLEIDYACDVDELSVQPAVMSRPSTSNSCELPSARNRAEPSSPSHQPESETQAGTVDQVSEESRPIDCSI